MKKIYQKYKSPILICFGILIYGIISSKLCVLENFSKYAIAIALVIVTYSFNLEKAKFQIKSELTEEYKNKLTNSINFLLAAKKRIYKRFAYNNYRL